MPESFEEIVAGVTYPVSAPMGLGQGDPDEARAAIKRARSDADTIQALIGENASLRAENEALKAERDRLKLAHRLTEPSPSGRAGR